MTRFTKGASTAAFAAIFSMAAMPVAAADIPMPTGQSGYADTNAAQWDGDGEIAERHRYRRYRRNRVDAGDVLAGVLIIGGIAAIASAASKNNERRERVREDYRYRDYDRDRGARYSNGGEGIDRAVDMCLAEIERDVRVDTVDNVSRDGEGWMVTGRVYNGDGFFCRIGNDGRISEVTFSGRGAAYEAQDRQADDRQWDDSRYRDARRNADEQGENLPSYPGGPIDGDYDEDEDFDG